MSANITRKISSFSLLIGLLIALLLTLAFLQYRLQGQISDAERERMEINLRTSTLRLSDDFDREITGIYLGLQINADAIREKNWAKFARKYNNWAATTGDFRIVKRVALLQFDRDGNPQMFDFDQSKGIFADYQSPETAVMCGVLKERFGQQLTPTATAANYLLPTILENPLALLIPVLTLPSNSEKAAEKRNASPKIITDYIVVTLDFDFIKQSFFPGLANRYFRSADELDYDFAVFSQTEPPSLIYQSNLELEAEEFLRNVEAKADIFKVRLLAESSSSPEPDNRNSVISERSPTIVPLSKNFSPADQITARSTALIAPKGIWRIFVKHKKGSLESVVAAARLRNLAVNFGVLGLLGISAALIVVTAKRAQRLARQKTEFAANVSHELRTPLAVISLAGENLADGVVDVSPEARSYGAVIKTEADRLTETIEQVLALSASQSDQAFKRELVDMTMIVDQAIAACRAQIEQKGFTIERKFERDLPLIEADKTALLRAIQNLLNNSIKYSDEKRFVRIGIRFASDKKEIVVAIEDQGIGIQTDELEYIFEPFSRGREAIERQIQGSGLGLTMVRRIVAAHGGTVSVRSTLGRGSVFSIHLPVAKNLN